MTVPREKPLDKLLEAIDVRAGDFAREIVITGIGEDSRRIENGMLFVAIAGAVHDGVDFVNEAIARGAAAVVSERPLSLPVPSFVVPDARRALAALASAFFDAPTNQLRTIGVTGTNGKTTVCHWIAHLLGSEKTELVSTVANEERALSAVTTPSSPTVQGIARRAADAGKENLVIEASSIGLAQHRLDAVAFDIAAFTNLSHDHLDVHGDLSTYLADKARLFRALDADGWCVVNADDAHADPIVASTRGQVLKVGQRPPVDVRVSDVVVSGHRTRFRLHSREEATTVDLPAVDPWAVQNGLVAVGVGLCAGLGIDEIVDRLETAPPVPGRWFLLRDPTGTTAVVDFAHNPEALQRAVKTLRDGHDRLVVVFGCPGESDRHKRPRMGEISGRIADLTILTTDNPKHERPEAIIAEIARGLRPTGGLMRMVVDRAEAIRQGVEEAGPSGVVLIAGKGHERYQIVRGAFVAHSDIDTLGALGFAAIGADASTQPPGDGASTGLEP